MSARARRLPEAQSRERQQDLEEIPVDEKLHFAFLQLHEVHGDRKSEAGAFRMSRFVAAGETIGDVLRRKIHLVEGDVFEGKEELSVFPDAVNIDSRAGEGVFFNIGKEVFEDAVGALSVQPAIDLLFRQADDDGEIFCGKAIPEFPVGLIEEGTELSNQCC